MNQDKRPKKNDWAPGLYSCKCHHCEQDYMGDKRSSSCGNCAYSDEGDARYKAKLEAVKADWAKRKLL